MEEVLRREFEQCDRVEDILMHSCQYGSSTGLLARLREHIGQQAPKATMIHLTVTPPPSHHGLEVVSSYNNIMAADDNRNYRKHNYCQIFFENERLAKHLEQLGFDNTHPDTMSRINNQIAEQASALTAVRRFGGEGFRSFKDLMQTMIINPDLNHFSSSRGDLPGSNPDEARSLE